MSAAARACPECGHPNELAPSSHAAPVGFAPRGLIGPVLTVSSPSMQFGDAVKSFFKNYAVFSGRARRSEYWFAVLFIALIGTPISILDAIVNPGDEFGVFNALGLVWSLVTLVPSLAIASRRLHDADTSFGYYFMIFIPLVGAILLIVKLATEGTPGQNRFGESPKFSE